MSENTLSICEAISTDIPKIQTLLTSVGLLADDVLAPNTRYWLAVQAHAQPVGLVGVELGLDAVLLRSAAVHPSFQGQGLGTRLVQHALTCVATTGYKQIYLFSTSAGAYWQRLGFQEVPVSELVTALPAAPQVMQYKLLGWLPTEVAWRHDLG